MSTTANNTVVRTIEQALRILAYNEHFWQGFKVHPKDFTTLKSLAEAQYPLTEKQGKLAVALLKRYHSLFLKYNIDLTGLFNNPVFEKPFRVIDYEKTVEHYQEENGDEFIEMKFPYNKKLVELIRTLRQKKTENLVPMTWDGEKKKWTIPYTAVTCYWITLIAVRYDFRFVTPHILDDYEAVKKEKLNYKRPYITMQDQRIVIKNASEHTQEYWQNNYANKKFIHQVDALKQLEIENTIEFKPTEDSTLTDRIAMCSRRDISVRRERWSKEQFLQALIDLDSLPAIVITGADFTSWSDIKEILDWYRAFERVGIAQSQCAWGYNIEDAPDWKKHDSKENLNYFGDPYPKELSDAEREKIHDQWQDLQTISKANKHIDANTKLVFVRNKIPRTLMKSGIKCVSAFTLFDSAYWPMSTESLSRVVENLPKRLYYVSKGRVAVWLTNNTKYELV